MDKEVQFLVVVFCIVFYLIVVIIISLVNYIQRKKVQYLFEKEKDKAKYEEQLLKTKVEISEKSMQNIGWELHDNIGQLLSVASIQTKILVNQDKENQHLVEVSQLLSQSLTQIRSLSKSLNHEMISKMGIVEAIENELDRLSRMDLIKTHFVYDDDISLRNDQEIVVFRIIQEFISNTIKHAQATELTIELKQTTENIFIQARDNGVGFNIAESEANNGLLNLRSRATMIGGELGLFSEKGIGTSLTMKLKKT